MRYAKALVAVVVAGLTAIASVMTDELITSQEWLQVAVALTTAVGVWLAPDLVSAPWVKTAVAMLLAGLNFAGTVITGGITPAEWVNLGLAVIGVIGVGLAPNPDLHPAGSGVRRAD